MVKGGPKKTQKKDQPSITAYAGPGHATSSNPEAEDNAPSEDGASSVDNTSDAHITLETVSYTHLTLPTN